MKGIVVLSGNGSGTAEDDPYMVTSASSDGVIRVWDVRMANREKPNPLAEVNTKSRLTCLAGSSLKCEYVVCLLDLKFSFFAPQCTLFHSLTSFLVIVIVELQYLFWLEPFCVLMN